MKTQMRVPRFTPAMAVAILAIVIALSSSATAALMITGAQIKNGSVTGKDLKKKSVAAKHLKKNAVRSKHVKNHSLTGADVRLGSLTGEHLKDGSVTLSDVSRTLVDALGNGVGGFEVITRTTDAEPLSPANASGSCPGDKVAISANAYWTSSNTSAPQLRRTSSTAFSAEGANPLTVADSLIIQVTCVNP